MDASRRARLLDADRRHVWHPYTQMSEYADRDPVIVERAEGVRLFDVDGRSYYDGVSSIWLNVHGHRVPELDRAVLEQLGRVAHTTQLGQGSVPAIELAQRLSKIAPSGLSHVFYSDNGSCAIEAAIKMSLQYWRAKGRPEKQRLASFEGGYHGDTMGAVGLAPVPMFHEAFLPTLPPPLQAPFPDCYRSPGDHHPDGCASDHLAPVEAFFRRHHRELAAFFVEPMVQGVAGMRVMPSGFLRGLRELCDRYEVLLVADEVATGLGRTAKLWACDHERVRPDLLAVGKGLTGGYLPLAATLATDEIYDAFLGNYAARKTFFHGHSYTGNQLACAAALANLKLLEDLMPHLATNTERMSARLRRFSALPFVGDVRGLGFLRGIELVTDPASKIPFPFETRAAWLVADEAKRRGMLVRPIANVSLFAPPLATPTAELDAMLDILYESHAAAGPPIAATLPRTTLAR